MIDIQQIQDKLQILPHLNRIVFGASCSERMFPNYLAFNHMENIQDDGFLRIVLDEIWNALVAGESNELAHIDLEQIINLAPDTEDFSSLFTAMAGNAVAGIVYTIEGFLHPKKSIEKISIVSRLSVESIDAYLVAVNDSQIDPHALDPSMDGEIYRLPLMVTEINKQEEDLAFLEKTQLTQEIISHLRQTSANTGINPIKRGLAGKLSL